MENELALNNNEINNKKVPGISFKESKEVAQKLFKKSVEIQTKTNKIKLKMLPLVLKVTSIFAPEAAPVLLPLSTFLKTEAGKAMIEMGSKGQDALNEYVNGDKEKAKEMVKENYDRMMSDEGTDLLNGVKNTIDESIKNSGGMVR